MRHFITFRGIDDGNDIRLDVSAICNSQNTSVTDARCTRNLTSASSQASFTVGYTPDKVTDPYDGSVIDREALYGQVVQYVLTAVERKAEMHVEILDDTRTSVIFTGMVDPTDISITRGYIPRSISLSCRDYTTDLDRKPGRNLVFNNTGVNEIVNTLLDMVYGAEGGHNGIGDGLMHTGVYDALSDLPDTRTVEYFVITADESTTYRKVIDTLLLEAGPGHVLHYVHSSNRFEIVRSVPSAAEGTQLRTVAYRTGEGIQARTGVYKYDGILLKWPTVEVRESDNVYAQEIELKYSQDGGVTGALLANGAYYPADGDITPTRQDYRKGDYDYVTGVSRSQNRDLGLLYATDAELGILAEPVRMRDRGTVADMDALAALQDPKAGDYAKVTDINEYRAYDGSSWVWTQAPSLSSDGKGNVYHDKGVVTTYALLPSTASEGDFYKCSDTGITWCRMDGEWQRKISLFLFPVLETADVSMTDGNPAFYPRSMWALGRNRSGGMVNLLTMSVTATSVSRVKENRTTHPAVLKEPEEYTATYIFDTDKAESFALWLYNAHRIACTTVTWNEWEDQRTQRSVLGECVNVEFMPGRKAVFCVIQIDDTGITRLKRGYKVTALLVSGFESAFSGTHEVTLPSAGSSRQAVQAVYSYAVSSSGSVTPTSWSDVRNPEQGKYLWTKTVTYYSDGTSETTYSSTYIPRDGEDADLTGYSYEIQYGLSISPVDFEFPPADYGYENGVETDTFGDSDDDDDAWGFLDAANWSGTYTHWVKGLYVWQRLKVTDRDGNVTYTDPSYCRDLTESLINGCVLEVVLTDSDGDGNTQTWEKNLASSQAVPLQFRLKSNAYPSVTALQDVLSEGSGISITLYKAETVVGSIATPSPSSTSIDSNTGMVTLVYDFSITRNNDCDSIVINAGIRDTYISDSGTSYDIDTTATETMTAVDVTMHDVFGGIFASDALAETWFTSEYGGYMEGYTYALDHSGYNDHLALRTYFGGSWMFMTNLPDSFSLARVSAICGKAQKDVMSRIPSGSVSMADFGYFNIIIANVVTSRFIGSKQIQLQVDDDGNPGYIYGGDVDPTQNFKERVGTKGFIIDTLGQMEASEAYFKNCEIDGASIISSLVFSNGAEINHPYFKTISTQGSDMSVQSLPSFTHWYTGDINWSSVFSSANSFINLADSYIDNTISVNWGMRVTNPDTALIAPGSSVGSAFLDGTGSKSATLIGSVTYRGTYTLSMTLSGSGNPSPSAVIYVNGSAVVYGFSSDSVSMTLDPGDSVTCEFRGFSVFHSCSFSVTAGTVTLATNGYANTGIYLHGTSGTLYFYNTFNTFKAGSVVWYLKNTSNTVLLNTNSATYIKYAHLDSIVTGYMASLSSGKTFTATGSVTYNGVACTVATLSKDSASTGKLTIYDSVPNFYQLTMSSNSFYNISGSVQILASQAGVETHAMYPETTEAYDIGEGGKEYRRVYCVRVVESSRRELKTNIEPFTDDAVDLLNTVQVSKYNFKDDMDLPEEDRIDFIGYIADDTDERLSGKKHDRFNHINCIGVLIKAVQQLSAEIERLKGEK